MIRRLWNFVNRHRKKLIFSTLFVVGGVYVSRQVLLPRLQQYLIQRLLQDELMGGDKSRNSEATKKAQFERRQQVADQWAHKKLIELKDGHNANFSIVECKDNITQAKDASEKARQLKLLQVECLARTISAIYVLHLTLLLDRVGFNIISREIRAAQRSTGDGDDDHNSEEDDAAHAAHTAFLEVAEHLQKEGLGRIATGVRKAVNACVDAEGLAPQTKVTRVSFEKFFLEVCAKVDIELLGENKSVETLLPETLDAKVQQAGHPKQVKILLDEARDWVESPQFLNVFKQTITDAVSHTVADAQPLVDGGSCPLAKLFGQLMLISIFGSEGCNAFVSRFASNAVVSEFCEAIYFGEESGGQNA